MMAIICRVPADQGFSCMCVPIFSIEQPTKLMFRIAQRLINCCRAFQMTPVSWLLTSFKWRAHVFGSAVLWMLLRSRGGLDLSIICCPAGECHFSKLCITISTHLNSSCVPVWSCWVQYCINFLLAPASSRVLLLFRSYPACLPRTVIEVRDKPNWLWTNHYSQNYPCRLHWIILINCRLLICNEYLVSFPDDILITCIRSFSAHSNQVQLTHSQFFHEMLTGASSEFTVVDLVYFCTVLMLCSFWSFFFYFAVFWIDYKVASAWIFWRPGRLFSLTKYVLVCTEIEKFTISRISLNMPTVQTSLMNRWLFAKSALHIHGTTKM